MTQDEKLLKEEETKRLKEEEKRKRAEENRIRDAKGKERLHDAITARIDQLCKERDTTQYELAYRASMAESSLNHIMKGSSKNPTVYNIMKICDGLDITLSEFFADPAFVDAMIESRNDK